MKGGDFVVQIYVENLSERNKGRGNWFELPVSMNDLSRKFGLDDDFDEYIITDYEAPFDIKEFDSIEKLNEIAEQLDEVPDYILRHMNELIGDYYGDIGELLIEWEDIIFAEGVTDDKSYGEYIVDEGLINVPKELEFYIDYEALGRDWRFSGNILYVDDGMFWIR